MKRYELVHMKNFMCFLQEKGLDVVGGSFKNWQQFNHCQAWYCEATLEDFITGECYDVLLLQSYETLVAVYWLDNGKCERLGKYSTTTSKQTTQWENALRRGEQVSLW